MKKGLLLGGVLLAALGIFLIKIDTTTTPSGCPGLGCNYVVHGYGHMAYVGAFLIVVGLVSFFEGLIFKKTKRTKIRLGILVACISAIVILYFLFSYHSIEFYW